MLINIEHPPDAGSLLTYGSDGGGGSLVRGVTGESGTGIKVTWIRHCIHPTIS